MTMIRKLEREARKKFKAQRKQAKRLERRRAQTEPRDQATMIMGVRNESKKFD
jgi:hypothetical protein